MEKALSGFLHGAARRLTGRQARRGHNGKWHYPSLVGSMKEAGLTDVGKSIANRQNTVAQYIRRDRCLFTIDFPTSVKPASFVAPTRDG